MRTTPLIALILLITGKALSAANLPPEISQGVRVLMGESKVLETKKEAWAFFVPQQLDVLDVSMTNASYGGSILHTPTEVVDFFSKLPKTIQKRGLWITYLGNAPSKADLDKFSALSDGATQKAINLFLCLPKPATTRGSFLVAWACEQVSPRKDKDPVICQPKEAPSASKSPLWECAWSILK